MIKERKQRISPEYSRTHASEHKHNDNERFPTTIARVRVGIIYIIYDYHVSSSYIFSMTLWLN